MLLAIRHINWLTKSDRLLLLLFFGIFVCAIDELWLLLWRHLVLWHLLVVRWLLEVRWLLGRHVRIVEKLGLLHRLLHWISLGRHLLEPGLTIIARLSHHSWILLVV